MQRLHQSARHRGTAEMPVLPLRGKGGREGFTAPPRRGIASEVWRRLGGIPKRRPALLPAAHRPPTCAPTGSGLTTVRATYDRTHAKCSQDSASCRWTSRFCGIRASSRQHQIGSRPCYTYRMPEATVTPR